MLVGWKPAETRKALCKAIEEAIRQGFSLEGMPHHSGRKIQYAYNDYTDILKKNKCRISTTENPPPLENTMTEETNEILKIRVAHELP